MLEEQIKSYSGQGVAPIAKPLLVNLAASFAAGSALGKLADGPIKRQAKAFDKRARTITQGPKPAS